MEALNGGDISCVAVAICATICFVAYCYFSTKHIKRE